ncbi:MAG: class I mannose-6-phosphate isomerase [Planctomycetota bacterium]|nr:class I mannose-6-phosphate isomerase [Planctomycetota bacterium]
MTPASQQPVRLRPIPVPKPWGGKYLGRWIGSPSGLDDPIGERWEISGLAERPSIIEEPGHPFRGKTLPEWVATDPKSILGSPLPTPSKFPLLLKFIDSNRPLSIQVHPKNPPSGEFPKAESWVILECEPDSVLYLGFKNPMDRNDIRQRTLEGTLPDLLQEIPVHKGDCFFVPPGTVHAIGKGILLAEIQQSSDTTYRLYDWGFTDPQGRSRPIHLEEALACIDTTPWNNDYLLTSTDSENGIERLFEGPPFSVVRYNLDVPPKTSIHSPGRPTLLCAISGSGRIGWGQEELLLRAPASILIPASCPSVYRIGNDPMTLLSFQPTES